MKNSTPQNLSAFLFSVVILVVCYISIGCSTALKIGGPKPEKITLKEPVLLQINPQAGEFERTRFHSHSISETYEGPTLRYAVTEVVDFVVESKTKVIDQKNGSIEFLLSTTEKSGPTNLGDLGFPEIGKSFDLVVTPQGKVLKAGKFPKTSLYYVPPISLPEKPVKVGDTWEMSHTWTSASNGMPMEVNLVSIFKSVYQCGAYDKCAEIEISGSIAFAGPAGKILNLKSEIEGRLLLNIASGSIVWSEVRNIEEVINGEDRVKALSCTESTLEDPVSKRWLWHQESCNPTEALSKAPPGV